MNVKTRFAPSPTGSLHIGSLRTAIYAYALAKHANGTFVLRIEDTDQKREVDGAVESLTQTLKDFGLNWDEYYVQSQRVSTGIYKQAAEKLVNEGKAFYCNCQPKNAKEQGFSKEIRDPCRDKNLSEGAIKLKVPDDLIIRYTDYVGKKEVQWNTSSVADATLLKSDGFPTYHLAVVVDDHEMEITHVLRGHDWKPSTPIHLLVYKFLNYDIPEIGHLTDILDPTGGKMSKRKGTVSVESFLNKGYLPEAIFNFVILLGWAPKDNREFFDLNDFVTTFDPEGFQTSNPVFNTTKLDWFNGQYIRKLDDSKLFPLVRSNINSQATPDQIEFILPLIKERIQLLTDIKPLTNFIWEDPIVNSSLKWKVNAQEHISGALEVVVNNSCWTVEQLNQEFLSLINQQGWKTGHFFMNLRMAISGQEVTPPITECIFLIGQPQTIERLKKAQSTI